jgi:SAM-dependent methyltransferase
LRENIGSLLKCPDCGSDLRHTKSVTCNSCKKEYPVLAGVLILVSDIQSYLFEHVKGISRYVDEKEIPPKYRRAFLEAKNEIGTEHIEEDLEAERVTSLYLMNHYLRSNQVSSPDHLLNELIHKHWDHGPFEKIKTHLVDNTLKSKPSLIELGCGVGGLYSALQQNIGSYLGLDSSFASVALARHFILGAPLRQKKFLVPHDLLQGSVSREVKIPIPKTPPSNVDFIVCDLSDPPVKSGQWQMSAALNVIDMLPDPSALPKLQYKLLQPQGIAIQSCPYIWHPAVSAALRKSLPKSIQDSTKAVEYLYEKNGFKIEHREMHVPWLFFKNIRQLEIYSVHLLWSKRLK